MALEPVVTDAAPYVAGPLGLAPGVGRATGFHASPAVGIHRGMPSPSVTFILTLGDGEIEIQDDDGARGTPIVLGGLHTRPVLIGQTRAHTGVEVAVHPLAVRALFGVPACELDVTTYSGSGLLGRRGELLREELTERERWDEKFATLGAFLLERIARSESTPGPRPELLRAWRVIVESGGRVRVRDVADDVGLSERRLRTLFVAEVGVGPKTVARLARFAVARAAIARAAAAGSPLALADVAAAAGYADQAHLAGDFRELAGVPPSVWVAEEFRNLQAGSPLATG